MSTITVVLIMLLLVVASGFIVRILPRPVPLPLVQIALGAMVAGVSSFSVPLDPDIFFLLFLPPLLFLDGWNISKQALRREARTILALALGLVLFTVLGMGVLLHWLIPDMPLAVAFALAAVLSPTDPVAVSAVVARVPMPERLMRILEGESLLNDASGLVCLRFAVAAALTGTFSLWQAAGTFLWLALGGVAIGVALTLGVGRFKRWLALRCGEETGSEVLISLLLPFGAYIIAEHLGCSGILAAVAGGIAMSFVESAGGILATTRVRRMAVWSTVQFAANGIIFVILGQQWPLLAGNAASILRESNAYAGGHLLLFVLVTFVGLAALRWLWVWISLRFIMLRARLRHQPVRPVNWRAIAVMTVAGVRGAITLAGVLTLPLFLNDGTPLPGRDIAIFTAASVIVLSLVVASIFLPMLLRGLELPPDLHQSEEDLARLEAAKAAIIAIEEAQHRLALGKSNPDIYNDAALRVIGLYRRRIDAGMETGIGQDVFRQIEAIEKSLRLAGLRAEREVFFKMGRHRQIEDTLARKLVREVDLLETRYS